MAIFHWLSVFAGASGVASALSGYLDYLLDHRIEEYLRLILPIDIPGLGSYPNFVAFSIIAIVTGICCFYLFNKMLVYVLVEAFVLHNSVASTANRIQKEA